MNILGQGGTPHGGQKEKTNGRVISEYEQYYNFGEGLLLKANIDYGVNLEKVETRREGNQGETLFWTLWTKQTNTMGQ